MTLSSSPLTALPSLSPAELDTLLVEAVASALGLRPSAPGLGDWQIGRVVRYIDSNLDRPIRVQDLAAVASLSTRHFHRGFVRSFGLPPHAYLVKRRATSITARATT